MERVYKKINNWTVLYMLKEKGAHNKRCICRCDCGRRIGYYKTLEEAVVARDDALGKEEFAIFI